MRSHLYSVVAERRKAMGGSLGDLAQLKVVALEPGALKKAPSHAVGQAVGEETVANKNLSP